MAHVLVNEVKALLNQAEAVHREVYAKLDRVRSNVGTRSLTQADRVDLGYLCSRLHDLYDDVRKEAGHVRELTDRLTCLVWTKQCEDRPDTQPKITGSLAVGMPDVKFAATLPTPRTDPEGYARLMEYVGVTDPDLIAVGAVRLHWPGMTEHISNLMTEGKPLPPGIDPEKSYPQYRVKYRQRKEE